MSEAKEMIIRMNSLDDVVEVAQKDIVDDLITFKKLDLDRFYEMIRTFYKNKKGNVKREISLLEDGIISLNERYCIVNQPESKKKVSLLLNDDLTLYNINFPNSLYVIEHDDMKKIISIECYSYREYKGEETELFEYAMPNELSGNKMCMGNAPRTIENKKIVEALNRIVYIPYSHDTFQGLYGFTYSKNYFEYLENNPFPYDKMRELNRKLKDIM